MQSVFWKDGRTSRDDEEIILSQLFRKQNKLDFSRDGLSFYYKTFSK